MNITSHRLIIGQTRSGKTVDFIKEIAPASPGAWIIRDPKGDDLNPTSFRLPPQPKERSTDDRPEGEVNL